MAGLWTLAMSFGAEKPPPRKTSLERDNHAYQRRQEGEGEGRGEPVHALPRLAGGRWKRGSARDTQSYMLNRLLDDVASSKLLALDEFGCVSFDAVGARLPCQAMPGATGGARYLRRTPCSRDGASSSRPSGSFRKSDLAEHAATTF